MGPKASKLQPLDNAAIEAQWRREVADFERRTYEESRARTPVSSKPVDSTFETIPLNDTDDEETGNENELSQEPPRLVSQQATNDAFIPPEFEARARERTRLTGVHAFNLPREDLEEMARPEGPYNAAETYEQLQASLTSSSSPGERKLAMAEIDLQTARVNLQNAYLKERLRTHRYICSRVDGKPGPTVARLKAEAHLLLQETKVARDKFDEIHAYVKEMRKVMRAGIEDADDGEEADPAVGPNTELLADLEEKIVRGQEEIWEKY